jgi:hypothetical protein
MITLSLKELCIRDIVLLLLFLVSLDPHFSSFLFAIDDFIEVIDFLVQLLLCKLKLSLNALLFGVKGLVCSHQFNDTFIILLAVVVLPRDHLVL